RRCSAACTVFFERQVEPIQRAPHRGKPGGTVQRVAKFRKRLIRTRRDQRAELTFSAGKRLLLKHLLLSGRHLSTLPPPLHDAIHPRAAHSKLRRDLFGGQSRVTVRQYACSQIHRVRRHSSLPTRQVLWLPYYVQSENALIWKDLSIAFRRID